MNSSLEMIWERVKNVLQSRYFFISALFVEAVFCTLFNFRGNAQSGLIETYLQYANFINSGFDFNVESYLYTFPMWGYGFILSITKSKVIIVAIQQLFSIGVILFIETSLSSLKWRTSSIYIFRVFAITSLPWFFFHTVIWPYSWGANFLMIGMFSILIYLKTSRLSWLMMFALSFGLMLNFRSDYLFFTFFLAVLLPLIQWVKNRKVLIAHFALAGTLIFALLIPWSQYSKIKSGHRLFKTTNKGHFLFISLGQLPNNPWGITPFDKDSVMLGLVETKLGQRNTMNYQADTFLTKEWFKLVKGNPGAFLEKCKVNFDKLHESPFYMGELWVHQPLIWEDSLIKTSLDKKIRDLSHNINVRTNENLFVLKILNFEYYQKRLITILFYLSLIAFLLKMKSRFYTDGIAMIMLSAIFYQTVISILTFYTKEHNTNLFLVYALWIIYVFGELRPINSPILNSTFRYFKSKFTKIYLLLRLHIGNKP